MKVSLLILNTVKQIKIKIFKYPFQISSFFPSIHPSLFSPLHRLYQFLPFRDRSGRRILMVLPGEELSKIPPTIKVGRIVCLFFCFGVDCEHRFCPILFLYYTILYYTILYYYIRLLLTSRLNLFYYPSFIHIKIITMLNYVPFVV